MIVFVAILLGALGAWFMSRYAFSLGLIDTPNLRSSHVVPTPRGGGVGLLTAFVFTSVSIQAEWVLWVPATCLSVMSFLDDRLDLSARFRLFAQFLASFVAVFFLYYNELSFLSLFVLVPLLAVFIAGTTNFYNFMDGINGIAGVTGVVAFGFLSWFAFKNDFGPEQFLLPLSIAGACAGFLPFNIPRARVFMGDVGSVLLGFLFALLVVFYSGSFADFLCLSGFLFLFYADAITTLFIRWRNNEQLSMAHRRHLYQVLANEMRLSHWKVSFSYGVLQAAICLLMVSAWMSGVFLQIISWVVLTVLYVFASWFLRMKSVNIPHSS